jgi:hypothetical protein
LDIVSLAFGILSIFVWPIAYVGFPVNILGLITGIIALRKHKNSMAVTGIILSVIGLVLTLVNLKVGILGIIIKNYFQT